MRAEPQGTNVMGESQESNQAAHTALCSSDKDHVSEKFLWKEYIVFLICIYICNIHTYIHTHIYYVYIYAYIHITHSIYINIIIHIYLFILPTCSPPTVFQHHCLVSGKQVLILLQSLDMFDFILLLTDGYFLSFFTQNGSQ